MEERSAAFARIHSIVSRVDLDATPVANLPAFRRFVLSSDSVCVHGEDRYTTPVQTIDRAALTHLVTPDAASMIEAYRLGIAAIEKWDEEEARFWSRIVGKDLLKCLRAVSLRRGGDYEQSIVGIHRQIASYAPESADLADLLIALYREPTTDLGRLRLALDMAEATLSTRSGWRADQTSPASADRTSWAISAPSTKRAALRYEPARSDPLAGIGGGACSAGSNGPSTHRVQVDLLSAQ